MAASSEPSDADVGVYEAVEEDPGDSGEMAQAYGPSVEQMAPLHQWRRSLLDANPDLGGELPVVTGRDPQVFEIRLPHLPAYQEFAGDSVSVGVLVSPEGEVQEIRPLSDLSANKQLIFPLLLNEAFNHYQGFRSSEQFQIYWFSVQFLPATRSEEVEQPDLEPEPDAVSDPEAETFTSAQDLEKVRRYLLPLKLGEAAQGRLGAWLDDIEVRWSLPEEPSLLIKQDIPTSELDEPQRLAFAILVDESGNLREPEPYPLQWTENEQLNHYAQQVLAESLAQGELELPALGEVVADVVVVDLIPTDSASPAIDSSSLPVQAPESSLK